MQKTLLTKVVYELKKAEAIAIRDREKERDKMSGCDVSLFVDLPLKITRFYTQSRGIEDTL